MDRWLWICLWLGLLGMIVTLWLFGLSLLSALGIAPRALRREMPHVSLATGLLRGALFSVTAHGQGAR